MVSPLCADGVADSAPPVPLGPGAGGLTQGAGGHAGLWVEGVVATDEQTKDETSAGPPLCVDDVTASAPPVPLGPGAGAGGPGAGAHARGDGGIAALRAEGVVVAASDLLSSCSGPVQPSTVAGGDVAPPAPRPGAEGHGQGGHATPPAEGVVCDHFVPAV